MVYFYFYYFLRIWNQTIWFWFDSSFITNREKRESMMMVAKRGDRWLSVLVGLHIRVDL